MSRKPKYSSEFKTDLVLEYLSSTNQFEDLTARTICLKGLWGLITKQSNVKYSMDFTHKVTTEYLLDGKSLRELMEAYKYHLNQLYLRGSVSTIKLRIRLKSLIRK